MTKFIFVVIASLLFGPSAIAGECLVYGITVAEHTSLYDSVDLDVGERKKNFIPPSTKLCITEIGQQINDVKSLKVTLGNYVGWVSDFDLVGKRIHGKPQDRAAMTYREEIKADAAEVTTSNDIDNLSNTLTAIMVMFCGFFAYFLPSIVATSRHHHQSGAILLVNLFFWVDGYRVDHRANLVSYSDPSGSSKIRKGSVRKGRSFLLR